MSRLSELAAAAVSNAPALSNATVYDGDTFTTDKGVTVRVDGIDTPELKNREGGTLGDYARAAMQGYQALRSEGGFNTPVVTGEVDKYGRSLGDMETADGRKAGDEMLASNLAMPRYSDTEDQRRLYAAGAMRHNFGFESPQIYDESLNPIMDTMTPPPEEGYMMRTKGMATVGQDGEVLRTGFQTRPNGDFQAGLTTGIASTKALVGGVGALMGIEGGHEYYNEQMDTAGHAAPRVSRIEDINGVGDFVDWLQGTLGTALPSLVPVIAGGGLGGLAGKEVAKRAIRSKVQERLAMQLTGGIPLARAREAIGSTAVNALMKRSAVGGYGGAWLANSAMQSSGIYNELKNDGIENKAVALVFGAAAGAAETAADVLLFRRLFPNAAEHEITDLLGLSKRIGAGMIEQGIAEGTAEGASQAIQLAAHAYADPSFDFWTIENRSQLMNAAAAGAAAGMVFGMATETVGGGLNWANAKKKDDVPHPNPGVAGPKVPPGLVQPPPPPGSPPAPNVQPGLTSPTMGELPSGGDMRPEPPPLEGTVTAGSSQIRRVSDEEAFSGLFENPIDNQPREDGAVPFGEIPPSRPSSQGDVELAAAYQSKIGALQAEREAIIAVESKGGLITKPQRNRLAMIDRHVKAAEYGLNRTGVSAAELATATASTPERFRVKTPLDFTMEPAADTLVTEPASVSDEAASLFGVEPNSTQDMIEGGDSNVTSINAAALKDAKVKRLQQTAELMEAGEAERSSREPTSITKDQRLTVIKNLDRLTDENGAVKHADKLQKPVRDFLVRLVENVRTLDAEKDTNADIIMRRTSQDAISEVLGVEIDKVDYAHVDEATDKLLARELETHQSVTAQSESDAAIIQDGKNTQELGEVDAMREALKRRITAVIGGKRAMNSARDNDDDSIRIEMPLSRRGQAVESKVKKGEQAVRRINLIEVVTLGEMLNRDDNTGQSRKEARERNLARGLESLGTVGDGKVQMDIGTNHAELANTIIGIEKRRGKDNKPITLNDIEESRASAKGRPENITPEITERTQEMRERIADFEAGEGDSITPGSPPVEVSDGLTGDARSAAIAEAKEFAEFVAIEDGNSPQARHEAAKSEYEAVQAQINVEHDRLFIARMDKKEQELYAADPDGTESALSDWEQRRYMEAKSNIQRADSLAMAQPDPGLVRDTGRFIAQDRRDRGRGLSAIDEGQFDERRELEFNAEVEDGTYVEPRAFGDQQYADNDSRFNIEMSPKSTDQYRADTQHDTYQPATPEAIADATPAEPDAVAPFDNDTPATAGLQGAVDMYSATLHIDTPIRMARGDEIIAWLNGRTTADFNPNSFGHQLAAWIERGTKGAAFSFRVNGEMRRFIAIREFLTPEHQLFVTSHEYGHLLFRLYGDKLKAGNLGEKQLYRKLRADFDSYMKTANAEQQKNLADRGADYMFDEWLANQFAAWASEHFHGVPFRQHYTPAQLSFFTKVADAMRKLWTKFKVAANEFGLLAPSYEQFVADVMMANYRDSVGQVAAAQFTLGRPGFDPDPAGAASRMPHQFGLPLEGGGLTKTTPRIGDSKEGNNWATAFTATKKAPPERPLLVGPRPEPNTVSDFMELSHFDTEKLRAHANRTRIGRASVKAYGKVSPIAKALSDAIMPTMHKVVGTSSHMLRHFGLDSVADQLPAYMAAVQQHVGIFSTQFRDIIGGDTDPETYNRLSDELRGKAPLSAKGKELRKLLDGVRAYYNDTVGFRTGQIGYEPDYYPGAFNREKLTAPGVRVEFSDEVAKHLMFWSSNGKEGLTYVDAELIGQSIYDDLVAGRQAYVLGDNAPPLGTAASATYARTALSKIAALDKFRGENPVEDIPKYIKELVHRAEQAKRWGGEVTAQDGSSSYVHNKALQRTMEAARDAGTLTQDNLYYVNNIIWPALMGHLGADIDPTVRKTIGYIQMYQNFRLLLMSTLSSIADLGLIVLRSGGDFGIALSAFKEAVTARRSHKELVEMSELLGFLGHHATTNLMHNMYDGAYMGDKTINKMNDAFFRAIQLQRWTDMTRMMGVSAAMKFVDKHIDSNTETSRRWMEEMRVDREAYKRWRTAGSHAYGANGRTVAAIKMDLSAVDATNKAAVEELRRELAIAQDALSVSESLTQFVNTATLNPNASQRPSWASDPIYSLVWHLKQFMYTMQTQIIDRAYKEMKANIKSGDTGQILRDATAAMSLLPLAGVGLVLRNALQYSLFGEEPPEDRQAAFELQYLMQLFERSGGAGVGLLVFDAAEATDRGGYTLLSLLGPTVGQFQSFLDADEDGTDMLLRGKSNEIMKAIPVLSQSYPLRKLVAEKLGG